MKLGTRSSIAIVAASGALWGWMLVKPFAPRLQNFATAGSTRTDLPQIHVQNFDIAHGDARPARLANCRTVETEYGECIDAGVYHGDPVLLLGRTPYLHVNVEIDMHGASMTVWSCDAGLCANDIPTDGPTPTIVVHAPDERKN